MRSTAPTALPSPARTAGAEPTAATPPARPRARPKPPKIVGQAVVLDRYRLVAPLGSGAFATVWRAVDERLAREVALKVVPQARVIRARFEREAWAAARLSHPAIVTLYEAASDRDAAYLVSELVRGSTLEGALAEGRLSDRAIVEIGVALCDALAYAHGQGIIHRDIKPSNILIPAESMDAAPAAKLTDFGVAHAIGGDSLTATGDVVGTAAYMAPEQAAGREARPVADLYALALVLYEGLTGINPLASIAHGRRSPPLGVYLPPLRRQRRDLPRELGLGIDLALRPRGDERGTIAELQAALEASAPAVSDKEGVVGTPWRPPTRPWRREEPSWPSAGVDPGESPTGRGGDPTRPWRPRALAGRLQERPEENLQRSNDPASPTLSVPARAGGAAAGAVVAGWLAADVLSSPPLAPAATALAVAGLLLALPRLGFVIAALALSVLAVAQGHAGAALVVMAAAAVAIAAAPRGRPPWTLAAGAPLLGVVGLAGAWPAFAARAKTAKGRAALGFTGWVWLTLASALAGKPLYVQVPTGGPSQVLWSGSPYEVSHHVFSGLITSGALAPAVVWAAAAVTLPLFVRRRSLVRDAAWVVGWAVLVVLLTQLAISLMHSGSPATLKATVLGAVASVVVALGPSALACRRTLHSGYPQPRVP